MTIVREIAGFFVRKDDIPVNNQMIPMDTGLRLKGCLPGGRNCEIIVVGSNQMSMVRISGPVHAIQLSSGWALSLSLAEQRTPIATLSTPIEIEGESFTVDLPLGTQIVAADKDKARVRVTVGSRKLYQEKWPGKVGNNGSLTQALNRIELSDGSVIQLNEK